MTERLTAEQAHSAGAAVIQGHSLSEYAARNPDVPKAALTEYWGKVLADVAQGLPEGAHWEVGSDW